MQTLEGFYLGESVPVNEKLSEIFLQLHISGKSGRCIPTIIESYGKEAIEIKEYVLSNVFVLAILIVVIF